MLGAHGWIDRRKTARGSTFNQATVGVEALGRNIDARLNAYVPLSGSRTYATPNIGRDAPYLAGSGVFYDTAGTLVEEPQGGFDIELGARLPVFEQSVDSIRVHGGGYHFGGDETPDVTGWRARVSADVTNWLQVGARFQKDSERGSQGFLEATLRFPGKASFRREGLRARLDESPERDIDIVTGAAVTDSGIGKPILDPTGNPQRVLHVDNTNGNGGSGTKDNPYSTLKAAEAAMKPYDVIYVHEGDGSTAGQSLGIVIDKPGVKLIGSGVDLVYEGGRVTGAAAGTSTGTVLAAATAAPVITNTQVNGDGVLVTADASLVSGIAVQGTQRDGVRVWANGPGAVIGSATVRDVATTANAGRGVIVHALAGGRIGAATLEGITSRNNTGGAGRGVEFRAEGAGSAINRAEADDINAVGNAQQGVLAYAVSGGQIDAAGLEGVTATGNAQPGVQVMAQSGGRIGTARLSDAASSGNAQQGILVYALDSGQIDAAALEGIITSSNAFDGVHITSNAARMDSITMEDIIALSNTRDGIRINVANSGAISRIEASGLQTQSNRSNILVEVGSGYLGYISVSDSSALNAVSFDGLLFRANGAGTLAYGLASNITATGNTRQGARIEAINGGEVTYALLQNSLLSGNLQQGLAITSGAGGNGILSASIESSTATANGSNGVLIDDDTTGAFTADLGGGALGSTGANRIYGNTGTDLRVDLDGGQLKAENNWWGDAAGLLPARVTLDAGGNTVDADPFLAADPGL